MEILSSLMEYIYMITLMCIAYIIIRKTKLKMWRDSSKIDEELGYSCKKDIKENIVKQNGGYLNYEGDGSKFDIVYEINGEIFREKKFEDIHCFCEFQIESNALEQNAISDDIYLDISTQKVKHGILVNSRIFLTEIQWNTLMLVDGPSVSFCMVCDEIVHQTGDHISEESHVENLKKHKPLKKYDDSITRMIDTRYHCAVCNETFERNNEKTHFDSQNHKDKMFEALNLAVDVNVIERNGNANENITNGTCEDKNEAFDDNNGSFDDINGAFDDNNGAFDGCNEIFDDNCESDSNYFRDNSEGFYDYDFSNDNCNGLQSSGVNCSYAAVARKPITVPKYITQVIGDKKLKVPYNSWHMIITPWDNKFYCMSCKISDHISMKAKHCMDNVHLENLMRCTVDLKYDRFLMRQIDLKYYHCGYCNELLLISDVQDHIIDVHDNKNKNINKVIMEKSNKIQNVTNKNNKKDSMTSNKSNIDSTKGVENDKMISTNKINESNESFKNVPMNQRKMNMLRELLEINNISPGLNDDIILDVFACKFRISFITYNTLLKDTERYYCVLCDLNFDENTVLHHIKRNDIHINSLRTIQFDGYFGHHLIRLIHQRAHCSICNAVFHYSSVLHHIASPIHINLLNQARNFIPEATVVKNKELPKQVDLNPTMHPMETNNITDSLEIKIESNQNNESMIDPNESIVDYNHEFIYLNFRNISYKLSFDSFNSLVVVGDGTKYCFVCAIKVSDCLKSHIKSVGHTKCMNECKFIDKYDKHVLRQIFLSYHCCICNVIFSKSHLNTHLSGPLELIKTNKIIRKKDIKSGIKMIHAKTKNEQLYPEIVENDIKILFHIKIEAKTHTLIKKESKIITVRSKTYKISWDSWQGLSVNGNAIFCKLCDRELKEYELNCHVNEENHLNILEKCFDEQYYPNLVRIVNDKTANCVTCNSFITNKKHVILEHLNGKQHTRNFNNMLVGNNCDNTDNVLNL